MVWKKWQPHLGSRKAHAGVWTQAYCAALLRFTGGSSPIRILRVSGLVNTSTVAGMVGVGCKEGGRVRECGCGEESF